MFKSALVLTLCITMINFSTVCYAAESNVTSKTNKEKIEEIYNTQLLEMEDTFWGVGVKLGQKGKMLNNSETEYLLTSNDLSRQDFYNFQWKNNTSNILYILGISFLIGDVVYMNLNNPQNLSFQEKVDFIMNIFILYGLGLITGLIASGFRTDAMFYLQKSITKYNKETLIRNMSIENKNENIMLNYKFEF